MRVGIIMDKNLAINSFLGSLINELKSTLGKSTLNALIYRIGQKSAEIIAKRILEKHKQNGSSFENISAAFNLFQGMVSQLFEVEQLNQNTTEDRTEIKVKNMCPFHKLIAEREDLEYGGTLCQFSKAYFEQALKILTGIKVEYKLNGVKPTEDYCYVDIVFFKDLKEMETKLKQANSESIN